MELDDLLCNITRYKGVQLTMQDVSISSNTFYPIPQVTDKKTLLNDDGYRSMYKRSIENPNEFWEEQGNRIHWFSPFNRVKNCSFSPDNVFIKWYEGGKTNASFNCLDRHLKSRKNQIAIFWEGDSPEKSRKITYQELYEQVCQCSNALYALGIKTGDIVVIYMPMIIEGIIAMLACARIGAIHSVVFAGFSSEALANRIQDCKAKLVITADAALRGGKKTSLKKNVDGALDLPGTESVRNTLIFKHTGENIPWHTERDYWWHEIVYLQKKESLAVHMDSEDPLFILYTSGSTGQPKALVHATGGYQVYASLTHRYVFDYNNGDVFWCNADIGWITGHTYITYGPLLNGATIVIHEGIHNYPTPNRLSKIIDKYRVNILYIAPTVIRSLMANGNQSIENTSRKSLNLLGSVGEPINPEAWRWYYETIGKCQCPVIDTWWQTETGGVLISPLPGATRTKPGSATRPFFGIQPLIVDKKNSPVKQGEKGHLVIKNSWPGQARTIFGNHQRFINTYFKEHPGYYYSGDGAWQDNDEYFWITGRVDDVINVSGHRFSTTEIENVLINHPEIAEVAVVGCPHAIKGQVIYAYVVKYNNSITITDEETLVHELKLLVRKAIGAIATPEFIQVVQDLPKTRSGKIMRRILRKVCAGEQEHLGDISTLADSSVIRAIIAGQKNISA